MGNKKKLDEAVETNVSRLRQMGCTRDELKQATEITTRWADEFIRDGVSLRVSAFAAMLLLSFLEADGSLK